MILGCSSSQFMTYRPAGSNDPSWQINVYHNNGVTNNFQVVINDSTVIDAGTNIFSGSLEEKGIYKGKEVKLIVTTSTGFLGDKSYDAMVFVSNELAGRFKF